MKPEFTAKQMDMAINKAWVAAREEALEEAAKIADKYQAERYSSDTAIEAENMAREIRALKEKP